jgi:catechol 2,3-dioxygenase
VPIINQPTYGVPAPGYRLPPEMRVGGVRLQVSDIARSVDYYGRTLGLHVLSESGNDVSLGAAGAVRPLVHLHEHPGTHPVPRGGRLGLYHFALVVPDRVTLGRFLAHLGDIGMPAATADHAVSEAIYLWDPDGLGIEVYADRPRDKWRVRGRELYMTTEPLNLRDLMLAGASERWTGMPVGTAMGHIHLHVGDLNDAEAFYHSALGLDKTVWSFPGALFLSAGGYHHHLGTNTWSAGAPPSGERDARLLQWEIVLPTAEDAGHAARSCATAGYPATREGDGWVVSDPWGTSLRIAG